MTMKKSNFGKLNWIFGLSAFVFGLSAPSVGWSNNESRTRTVEVDDYASLFGLRYETNRDWTYQCGEMLTRRVLEVLRTVPSAQRSYVLDQIRNIKIVDHEPSWFFGRAQPRAEYDEETQSLTVEFRRIEGQRNPRAYCLDSAYYDVVRLVTRWRQEAEEHSSSRESADRADRATDAGADQIRDLLDELEGVQRAPAVTPETRSSDSHSTEETPMTAPVAPSEYAPAAPSARSGE
jgi:hypothetical protein